MRGRLTAVARAVAVAAAIAAAAACGAATSSGASSGRRRILKGQTITYWASNQGATIDEDKQVLKASGQFTQQSGVKVNFKVIPWPDLFNNITTRPRAARVRTS